MWNLSFLFGAWNIQDDQIPWGQIGSAYLREKYLQLQTTKSRANVAITFLSEL